ncbi:CehA/McbA family metallohydrolase [Aquipuribacter nitratireducens]|uniref:CehA/McbA family metallohydrolase n=1 Tax=Aquipuribacter nitratireducens TaxID=650104 RepID=A0ABW0GI49_9MICO
MTDGPTASAGALLLRPASRGEEPRAGASRASGLLATAHADLVRGTTLLHADLHNHTDLSDGAGHADDAFACMRAAGLDAAALTDHAGFADAGALARVREVVPWAGMPVKTIEQADFLRATEIADAFDDPGGFTAVRGFEWTTPHLGHVNVWFSEDWLPPDDRVGIAGLHDWLLGSRSGDDALFGLNHPGREPLRFDGFRHEPRLTDRMVSIEVFNRDDDYLFEGYRLGQASPLLECLDAGWRPGLLGVSDEHGRRWGFEPGRGRAGLWVRSWDRGGLREALLARRFFATREPGLRLDCVVAAGDGAGRAARMGGTLAVPAGTRELAVTIDCEVPPDVATDRLEVQVLTRGITVPTVLATAPLRSGEVGEVTVGLQGDWDAEEVPWLVVRVADPTMRNLQPGPAGHPANNRALAYASPVQLVAA